MNDRELRLNLAAIGALLPVFIYEGRVIDGARRERLCGELGLRIERHDCATLQEACSVLWSHHPVRALELAGPRGLLELAELCSVSPTAIARVKQAIRGPRKRTERAPRQTQGQKTVQVLLWMEPQLKHYAKRAAEQEGLTLSAFVRKAIWQRAKILAVRAPGEDSVRAPRWEKPREKRVAKRAAKR
jgi:hypothetical protein